MHGQLAPFVLVPRFTSFIGQENYSTAPVEVSAYAKAHVSLWRGPFIGDLGTGNFGFKIQESHDAYKWTTLATPTVPLNGAVLASVDLTRRWMRLLVEMFEDLSGNCALTCWATGYFEQRIPEN
jgi:hypothetical protein